MAIPRYSFRRVFIIFAALYCGGETKVLREEAVTNEMTAHIHALDIEFIL